MMILEEFIHVAVIIAFIVVIAPVMLFRVLMKQSTPATQAKTGLSINTWRRGG